MKLPQAKPLAYPLPNHGTSILHDGEGDAAKEAAEKAAADAAAKAETERNARVEAAEKKAADSEKAREEESKKRADVEYELAVSKLEKEFPDVDASALGRGTYEQLKDSASKLQKKFDVKKAELTKSPTKAADKGGSGADAHKPDAKEKGLGDIPPDSGGAGAEEEAQAEIAKEKQVRSELVKAGNASGILDRKFGNPKVVERLFPGFGR